MLAGHNVVVEYVRNALASVTDLVVFLRRTPEGRRIDQVLEVHGWDGTSWRHRVLYEAER